MKIVTTDHGPSAYPKTRWTAIDQDTCGGAPDSKSGQVGYGDTESEAVSDLFEQRPALRAAPE